MIEHTHCSKIIRFEIDRQTIRAEAGISLDTLIDAILPHGLFLPVSPGTRFVTLGGAVAADIHGKNHHRDGSMGEFVDELTLLLPNGEQVVCGPSNRTDLFYATIGGMGLTGAIVDVTLRLLPVESAQVRFVATRTKNLEETLEHLEVTSERFRYSVSWIDALAKGEAMGRGWVLAGDHAKKEELPNHLKENPLSMPSRTLRTVPFFLPRIVLNRWSCGLFNRRVYERGILKGSLVDLNEFFYPLDRVRNWNRIYGRPGFIQYQSLFPFETAQKGLRQLLQAIFDSGHAAFSRGSSLPDRRAEGYFLFYLLASRLASISPIVRASKISSSDWTESFSNKRGGSISRRIRCCRKHLSGRCILVGGHSWKCVRKSIPRERSPRIRQDVWDW